MDKHNLEEIHPLAATLARLKELEEFSGADMGNIEAGWFSAADLMLENSPVLDRGLARQAEKYPAMKLRTRGSYFIGEYSLYVAAAAVAAYLAERRVPDLSPENLALRYSTYTWHEEGESGEASCIDVRFLSGRFTVLPDDPAASHPDAVVLPDENALRERLRTALEAHLTPLIDSIHTVTRLGKQSQWCLAADTIASIFMYTSRTLRDEQRGQAEGLAFLKVPGSPLNNPRTGYVTLHQGEHCETFRARAGCCLYYTVAQDGYKCATCVLRPTEERDRLLLDYMTRKYAQGESA